MNSATNDSIVPSFSVCWIGQFRRINAGDCKGTINARIKSYLSLLLPLELLFSCLLLAGKSDLAYSQSVPQIARVAFASTVLLVMEDSNGQPMSLGSGFFVGKGVIATNLHVVERTTRGYAKVVGQNRKYEIQGTVGIDVEHDLVLLQISVASMPTLSLGNSDAVEVGEPVYAVGNPEGLEGTFSQGIVSSIRHVGSDKLLQVTAPISPGSSGGPVLNTEGKVIGIAVATFKGGQNLNFAIPVSYLGSLISKARPVTPLSSIATFKQTRSLFGDLGGRNVEGVVGGDFTWSNQLYDLDGKYSFTLRNQLHETVRDIYFLVVFYDRNGNALDSDVLSYKGVVPAGLGKRVNGSVDASLKRLTTPPLKNNHLLSSFTPTTKVEFRILNFKIVE